MCPTEQTAIKVSPAAAAVLAAFVLLSSPEILAALLLAALDIGCYWAVHWFIRLRNMNWQKGVAFMVTIYLCSIFAWILLYGLWKLLGDTPVRSAVMSCTSREVKR